ncbi:MAG: FAD:protein FMN transferase [candidate division SR1 bacterium]|nr:FAD:protein FMN transferase [candidate division SR1 bacterium]
MKYTKTKFLMGTDVTITIFGEENPNEDIEHVFEIFHDLEKEFSRFRSDSDLSRVNRERSGEISDTFIDVIKKCKEIYTDTDGYFNPLINVSNLGYSQNFHSKKFKKKTSEVNLELEKVEVRGNTISLQQGQNLDLGGIVKGYGVDKAKEYLEKKGHKNYIIDAGGDIYTAGLNETGGKIVVGIDSPFIQDNIFATLEVENTAVATSGNYKRKWTIDDQVYTHIINPMNAGNNNEIISITLITENCYLGDAYATACIAMGKEKAVEFLKKHRIDGVIICTDKTTYITEGMKKYNLEVI